MNKIKMAKKLINCAQSLIIPEYEEVQQEMFSSIQETEPDFHDKIIKIMNMLPPPFLDGTITVKIEYNKTTDFNQNDLKRDNIGNVIIQLARRQPFYLFDNLRKQLNKANRYAMIIIQEMEKIGLTDRKILVVFK